MELSLTILICVCILAIVAIEFDISVMYNAPPDNSNRESFFKYSIREIKSTCISFKNIFFIVLKIFLCTSL